MLPQLFYINKRTYMSKESAYTSTRQIPSTFTHFTLGPINFDFGGGKYDDATLYLKKKDVINLLYDPFNRDLDHNEDVYEELAINGCHTATCANVLNVVNETDRQKIYKDLNKVIKLNTGMFKKLIFQIYKGDGSGIKSTKTVQNNQKVDFYYQEIKAFYSDEKFRVTKVKSKFILVEII